jgi:hypothetical protein
MQSDHDRRGISRSQGKRCRRALAASVAKAKLPPGACVMCCSGGTTAAGNLGAFWQCEGATHWLGDFLELPLVHGGKLKVPT